jgi:YegS/Rv2252/BmrU family lipid kinase
LDTAKLTYRIIVNPASGRGNGARAIPIVERVFGRAGVKYKLVETTAPGQAQQLARDAIGQGYDVIVAVGGDGTAHEVVNGLVQLAQERGDWATGAAVGPVGLVPLGTGNDFAWRLGIPENDPEAACRLLLADRRRTVDLGQLSDERGVTEVFHNHMGGGFEAATAIESQKIRRLHGLLLYLTAVFRVLPKFSKAAPVTVRFNDITETRPILLASAANGGRTGGGFKIAPQASLDDGQLDLVLADSPNVAIILWLLPHFLLGTHGTQKKYVALHRTPHVIIEAPAGLPVHLDGEIFRADARRIEVKVLPKRLQVIAGLVDW